MVWLVKYCLKQIRPLLGSIRLYRQLRLMDLQTSLKASMVDVVYAVVSGLHNNAIRSSSAWTTDS